MGWVWGGGNSTQFQVVRPQSQPPQEPKSPGAGWPWLLRVQPRKGEGVARDSCGVRQLAGSHIACSAERPWLQQVQSRKGGKAHIRCAWHSRIHLFALACGHYLCLPSNHMPITPFMPQQSTSCLPGNASAAPPPVCQALPACTLLCAHCAAPLCGTYCGASADAQYGLTELLGADGRPAPGFGAVPGGWEGSRGGRGLKRPTGGWDNTAVATEIGVGNGLCLDFGAGPMEVHGGGKGKRGQKEGQSWQ